MLQDSHKSGNLKSIFETVRNWLLVVFIITCLSVTGFMIFMETNIAVSQIYDQFKLSMEEVSDDLASASDRYQINLVKLIISDIEEGDHDLVGLANWYNVSEINIVNKDGIIIESTNPNFINFDMKSGEQSAEFLCLLDNCNEFAQPYMPISADGNTYMKYAGVKYNDGFVQMGYNADCFQDVLNNDLKITLKNRHIGKTGFFIVFDEYRQVISASSNYKKNIGFDVKQIKFNGIIPNSVTKMTINGKNYFCIYNKTEGYELMAFCAVEDAMSSGIISICIGAINMTIVFAVLFIFVYILIKKLVVNQIISIAESLTRITEGNLDEVVNVRSNKEFSSLSDNINSTVDTLKRYIAEEANRINAELEFARNIQLSAIPSHFPSFPSRKDFDIFATMNTAKEVGGDFYDFYFTDNSIFNFMIADVSGKGIPAALFMMRSKSVLRGQTENGFEVNDVFTRANDTLCEDNDLNMFVTAWQGQINLDTGLLQIANAGHNPAIIKHADGPFEYLKLKPNLMLASMEGIQYRKHEVQLKPGDIIYLYTDGVTEATNSEYELYGDERLINFLNGRSFNNIQEICDLVKSDIDAFVKDAPQFDDITMVAFRYNGPTK